MLFLSALIPGLYHMTTGALLRGALIFAGVLTAANFVVLLCILPPFAQQKTLVVIALFGASLCWAAAMMAAAARHRTLSGTKTCRKS